MKNILLHFSSLLFWISTSPLHAQAMLHYRPEGLNPSQAIRQTTIETACDPVIVAPGSYANEEQAQLTGILAGYLGPTPVPPGMAVPPPSLEFLDVAKGIFDRWSDLSCVMSDGKPRLQLFEEAVIEASGLGPMKEVRPVPMDVAQRQIEAIRQRYPGTIFAILVEAHYLNAVGWDARGGGYNGSVTQEGEKIFEQSIAKELELLSANKSIGTANPDYYNALLSAQGSTDGYSPSLIKTFKEAATKYKFYSQFYFTTIGYTQEKWGGSPQAMDELIKWSADNTRAQTGDWMYARLYGYVAVFLMPGENLFSVTNASWPTIRKGYTEHLVQEVKPSYQSLGISANMERVELNLLVRFSCEAGDQKTFIGYRPKLDAQVLDSEWHGPLTLPVCDEKFHYRSAKR